MPRIHVNGIELHYEERGDGEPLLLIMGLGADGSLWAEHVQAYERHFRCIIPDNRGAGHSDKPPGPYSTAMMAADMIGLLDAIGIARAHVAGISMGGCIAQEMALQAPHRVGKLVLIGTWPKCDAYTTRIFEMFRALIQTSEASAFIRMLQLWIFTPNYHAQHMDDLLRREARAKANPNPMPPHAFVAQCDACIAHDTLERLGAIRAPTLITGGDQDIFTPMHYAKALHQGIAGSQLLVFAGGGHAHHFEAPETFNAKTIAFLQSGVL